MHSRTRIHARRMAAGAISPKTQLAGLLAAVAALVSYLITTWTATDPELSRAIVGVSTALFAVVGAYLGVPGTVENTDNTTPPNP